MKAMYKRCVKRSFVEKPSDELEDDNPSNGLDDFEISGSGSGNRESRKQSSNANKVKHHIHTVTSQWQPGPGMDDAESDEVENNK